MGPVLDSITELKAHIQNITMSTSLSDFHNAVEKLDSSGANWVMFKSRFMIAIDQKDVEGHFDGSESKPVLAESASEDEKRPLRLKVKHGRRKRS
jgi:hypothetical protein